MKRVLGTFVIAALAAACSSPAPKDLCGAVDCGPGRCVLDQGAPACLCDLDYVADGLYCVPRFADPCGANPCVGLSTSVCVVDAGSAACVCPAGRVEIDGQCVVPSPCAPNPCTTTPRKTVCDVVSGAAQCSCEPGYAPDGDACEATPRWTCDAQHDGPGEDDAEPDECPPLASALEVGAAAAVRSLLPAGDHDWFSLPVPAGHVIAVTATATSGTQALLLELYDGTGLTLLGADTRGGGTARVSFAPAALGAVMLRVRAPRATDLCTYTIAATDLGPDDYVNVAAGANEATPGARFDGEVQYPGDRDVVRLAVPAATAVSIDMLPDAGDFVVDVLRVDGGAGRTLAGESLVLASPVDEPFLLVARGRNGNEVGRFFVSTADLGPDDHSDEPAFATRVQLPVTATAATFERVGDLDAVRFSQLGRHFYSSRCLLSGPSPGSYPCSVTVRGSDGVPLSESGPTPFLSGADWKAGRDDDVTVLFRDRQIASQPMQHYTWTLEDLGIDDHGDTPDAGLALSPGTAASGRLEVAYDVDAFTFSGTAGHAYEVSLGAPDLSVKLLDAAGTVLMVGQASSSALAPATGTYGVLVSDPYPTNPARNVPYAVTVTDLGLDDHGNTASTATSITLGQAATGAVQYQGDVDVLFVPTSAGRLYQAACTAAGSLPCRFRVRSSTGFVLEELQSPATARFEATTAGSFIEVLGLAGWSMTVTDIGVDDHGNLPSTATTLTVGASPVAGDLEVRTDVDVFALPGLTAGRIVRVSCTGPAAVCSFSVTDPSGNQVGSSVSGDLAFRVNVGGRYTVMLGTSFGSVTGAYALTATDQGVDDHGDLAATATSLAVGQVATGAVQYVGDVDAFATPLTVGRIYEVACTSTATPDCRFSVSTAAGTRIADSLGQGTAVARFKATSSGAVIQVNDGASWSLTVADVGVDDHGDTAATATPLVVDGAPVPGVIELGSDVDVFAIAGLAVGSLVQLTCSGSVAACNYSIRDSFDNVVTNVGGTGPFSFRVSLAGTHTVHVGNLGTGAYALTAQTGTDDHGNSSASATFIATRGAPVSGVMDYAGDVDVFSFAATAGAPVVVLLQSASSGLEATVKNPAGGFISSALAGTSLTFNAPSTGTYTVWVSPQWSWSSGGYSVTVQ